MRSRLVAVQLSAGQKTLSLHRVIVFFSLIRCVGLRMAIGRNVHDVMASDPSKVCCATLTRRTKKAKKKARKLRELDARQRHKLRIAIKKLRYAGDFFGSLLQKPETTKRLSTFQGRLKDLQEHLGALNDIQVHQKLVPKLALGNSQAKTGQRVFSAGVVSGRELSEIEPLLSAAAIDARKFAKVRPFWA